jgi:hypothetical protein
MDAFLQSHKAKKYSLNKEKSRCEAAHKVIL